MTISGRNVGVGITGSFCTFSKVTQAIRDLTAQGATVLPIFSYNAQSIDSRFGTANYWLDTITQITGKDPILTIPQAEPLGPKNMLDLLLIAPCTGNTLAKLANGITDTPVLMAAKGHLRNNKPLVIFLSSNDALGCNLKNIGQLMNMKHIYFVPFGQDDWKNKPRSLQADFDKLHQTLEKAKQGVQIQPLLTEK